MFKKLAVLAATVAGAGALAVGGAAVASAAPSALVSTTTNFSYTVNQATVHTNGIVPPNHTPVVLDLTAAIRAQGVPAGQAIIDAANDALALRSGATPVLTLANEPTPAGPNADLFLKLFAVNDGSHSFQLAATAFGAGIPVPPFTIGATAPTHGFASVTWERFVAPVNHAPYVYNGHRLTVSAHSATVGWSDSQFGWPTATNGVLGNHCVMVFIYGFDKPAGQAHIGFTCDNGNPAGNVGYLSDLAAGHSVSLFVQPAEGSYLNHHVIPGTSPKAHIDVVTPAV